MYLAHAPHHHEKTCLQDLSQPPQEPQGPLIRYAAELRGAKQTTLHRCHILLAFFLTISPSMREGNEQLTRRDPLRAQACHAESHHQQEHRSHHIRSSEEEEEAGQTILDSWRGGCGDEARQVMSWCRIGGELSCVLPDALFDGEEGYAGDGQEKACLSIRCGI
jgi:hypothetical protein